MTVLFLPTGLVNRQLPIVQTAAHAHIPGPGRALQVIFIPPPLPRCPTTLFPYLECKPLHRWCRTTGILAPSVLQLAFCSPAVVFGSLLQPGGMQKAI